MSLTVCETIKLQSIIPGFRMKNIWEIRSIYNRIGHWSISCAGNNMFLLHARAISNEFVVVVLYKFICWTFYMTQMSLRNMLTRIQQKVAFLLPPSHSTTLTSTLLHIRKRTTYCHSIISPIILWKAHNCLFMSSCSEFFRSTKIPKKKTNLL